MYNKYSKDTVAEVDALPNVPDKKTAGTAGTAGATSNGAASSVPSGEIEPGTPGANPPHEPDSTDENLPIKAALQSVADGDPGAIFEAEVLDKLRLLKADNPAAFARVRKAVKDSKSVSMQEFDRQTVSVKSDPDEDSHIFPAVELYPEPVDGVELLNDTVETFQKYVIADLSTLRAAALWVLHTWLMDAVQVSPIANITAPELRCGKTTLLSAMSYLVARPINTANISAAALFRCIEQWQPTLMIDETDSFLRDNEDARGILNAGFTRDSAYIIRCVGDDHQPQRFRVWGAKALCGIGSLASTLADRSVPLRMRRKLPHETAERLRHSDPSDWQRLRSKIARWAQDNRDAIAAARPADVPGLNDRAQDSWEPLLQISDTAGGEWPGLARAAAVSLHGVDDDAPSVGVELLRDIQTVFDSRRVDRLSTADLIAALVADDESPWPAWNRGKPLTSRQLAKRLGEFSIGSNTIRIGTSTPKGYRRDQFEDAFKRYLSASAPATSATPPQPNDGGGSSVFTSATQTASVAYGKQLQPSNGAACGGVADNPGRGSHASGWGEF